MVKIQKFNFDCMDVKIRFVNNYRNTEDDLSNPHRETHLYISLYNKVCIFIGCSPTITISPIFIMPTQHHIFTTISPIITLPTQHHIFTTISPIFTLPTQHHIVNGNQQFYRDFNFLEATFF